MINQRNLVMKVGKYLLFLGSGIFLSFLIYLIINIFSAYNEVSIEDFEDDPTFAASKILENFENLSSGKVSNTISITSDESNLNIEINQFFDQDLRKQIIFFSINSKINGEILDTKGTYLKEKNDSYLIFNRLASSDKLLQTITSDKWYEIDTSKKTSSLWLNLLTAEMSPRNFKKLLQTLAQNEVFKVKGNKTDNQEEIFLSFELDAKKISRFKNKVASLLKVYYPDAREISSNIAADLITSTGTMVVDKATLTPQSINMNVNGFYDDKPMSIGLTLDIEKNQNFPEEIKADKTISLKEFIVNSEEWKSKSWIAKLFNF